MRLRPAVLATLGFLIPSLTAQAGVDEGVAAYAKRDWKAALAEFKPLAADGNALAQGRVGRMILEGLGTDKNEAEGIRLLTEGARAGDPFSQNALGFSYLVGRGVPKQPATALVWFGRAADQDYPESLNSLAELYYNGIGVAKDEAKGLEFYQRAAEKGVAASQAKLADLYWSGRGFPQDRVKAVELARKAAEKQHPGAQYLLGLAAFTGDGGMAKNPSEAVGWFRQAADQGHATAQHNLGYTLLTGTGIARNPAEAYFWLALSAERAGPNIKSAYAKERDDTGAALSPEEIAKAKARVATWKPTNTSGIAVISVQPAPQPPSQPAQPQPAPQQGPATVVAPPEPAVKGNSVSSTGSGILITRDGSILTNAHVVENCRTISVIPADGRPVVAALAAKDAGDDLALLKTSIRSTEAARFRQDKPIRAGDEVVVVGFPLSSLLSREANVTAGVVSALNGLRGDARHYQITAPVQKGNSGGPLSDTSGNVVGIVSSKLNAMKIANQTGDLPQNINFAIKSDLARTFLDRYQVRYETATVGETLSAADVGERIKRVTVYIQCRGG